MFCPAWFVSGAARRAAAGVPAESRVLRVAVLEFDVPGHPAVSLLGGRKGDGVGRCNRRGIGQTARLCRWSWECRAFGATVLDAEGAAGRLEAVGGEATAVISEDGEGKSDDRLV